MNIWIAFALIGAVLFLMGGAAVVRDYVGRRINRSDLLLNALAAVMVVPIVLTTVLIGTPEDPAPGFVIFITLWLALIAAICRRRQQREMSADRELDD